MSERPHALRSAGLPVPRWAPFALFVVMPFIVFPWRWVAGGMMDPGGDDTLQNLPYLYYSARSFWSLNLLWVPDLFMGQPLMAAPQYAAFYPLKLFLPLLPPVTGFTVYVLGHYVMAQCTGYIYLRAVGVSRIAATFGAVVYGFCGFMVGHRGHTMYLATGAWAPLFLFFVQRANRRGEARNYVGAAIAFGAVCFTGLFQYTTYLGTMTLVLFGAMSLKSRSLRPITTAIIVLTPAALVAGLQVLPSLDLAAQVELAPRQRFDFSTIRSFHPSIIPALVFLEPFDDPEYYTRTGVAALLAALAAVIGARGRPIVAAWSAVAAVALIMMMGKSIEPLARFFHALPIVGVFRDPARHNFEFGTAIAFLSAFGIDWLIEKRQRRLPGTWVSWAVGAPALMFVGALIADPWRKSLLATAKLVEEGKLPDEAKIVHDITNYLESVTWQTAIVPAILALIFIAIVSQPLRKLASAGAVAALVLAIVEITMAAPRTVPTQWPDRRFELAKADFRKSTDEFARVVPAPGDARGLDALGGNVPLLIDNMQQTFGYASAAPTDIVHMFDLDFHGFPMYVDDMRWGRLPTIFGVTHLIMPRAICAPTDQTFDAAAQKLKVCSNKTKPTPIRVTDEPSTCRLNLAEGRRDYELWALVQKASKKDKAMPDVIARGEGGSLQLHDSTLTFEDPDVDKTTGYDKHYAVLGMVDLPVWGVFEVNGFDERAVSLHNMHMVETRAKLVAEVSPASADGARVDRVAGGDGFLLKPEGKGKAAVVEQRVDLPKGLSDGTYRFEVIAIPVDEPEGSMTVTVHLGDAKKPAATIKVDTERFEKEQWISTESFDVDAAPEGKARFRLELNGESPIRLFSVRLYAKTKPETVYRIDHRSFGDYSADGVRIVDKAYRFSPGYFSFEVPFYMPIRPLTLTIDAEPQTRKVAQGFAVETIGIENAWDIKREIESKVIQPVGRFSWTVPVPPDSRTLQVALGVEGSDDPVPGFFKMRITDACRHRNYKMGRHIRAGLHLYENRDALPRAYTVGTVRQANDRFVAKRILRDDPSFVPGKVALVSDRKKLPATLSPGKVTKARFGQQDVELSVDAPDGPTFLVVNDRFERNWRATVDGKRAPIHLTNGLVRGVVVPRGKRAVKLWYEPPTAIYLGLLSFVLGLLLAIFGALPIHAFVRARLGG